MKYDDAEYQFLAFTNEDTPMEWGGRVIAMYLAWALSRDLCSEQMHGALAELQAGRSPVDLLFEYCDGCLLDEFLNEEGNAFAAAYYEQDYYQDFDAIFDGEYADTGHPADDALSIPDTPENVARVAAMLDQRFAQWKSGRLATTPEEVFELAERTLAPLLEARGMSPATERDWEESSELKGVPMLRFWGGDFDGGREWFFFQVVRTAKGVGLHLNFSSRIDELAKQAWTTDLRPHLNPRIPKPGDPLPLTALLRMAAWWPHEIVKSQEGPPAAVVASRSDLELLPRMLELALKTRAFPLLDRTHTAAGLGELQQFRNPAKAALSNAKTSLVPLLSAEHARRPDLMQMCDDWEADVRKLSLQANVLSAALLFVDIIRKRNGAA